MKATKRLFKAIIALVASLVLCIGVCLAWFASNGDVDANGLNESIRSINITKFEIEAYELTFVDTKTVGGKSVTTYTVGDSAGTTGGVTMAEYGGLGTTALLLKFTYSFEDTLNKNYSIYADCQKTRGEIVISDKTDATGGMLLECALSSVVSFYDIGEVTVGTTVTQTDEKEEKEVPDTDGNLITLSGGISDETLSGTFYCIIDYVEDKIYSQYYEALNIEGTTFSTPMDFVKDIEFYMGESSASV